MTTFVETGTNDFRISEQGTVGDPTHRAFDPAVTYNSTMNEFFVVWSGERIPNEFEIYGQRIDGTTGAQIGSVIRVSTQGPDGNTSYDAEDPSVAWSASNNAYVVVWSGDRTPNEQEIFYQYLAGNGFLIGSNGQLSSTGPDGDTGFDAYTPDVVWDQQENLFFAVWSADIRPGEREIFAELMGTSNNTDQPDLRVSFQSPDFDGTIDAVNPAIAYSHAARTHLVVWEGNRNSTETEIYGQRLIDGLTGGGANLTRVGTNFQISDQTPNGSSTIDAVSPDVAAKGNFFDVVWTGDVITGEEEIYIRTVSQTGVPQGMPTRISTAGVDNDTAIDARFPAIATGTGSVNSFVVWDADDAGTDNKYDIFGQAMGGANVQIGTDDMRLSDVGVDGVPFNADAGGAAIAHNTNDNSYLVVWHADDDVDGHVPSEYEILGQLIVAIHPPVLRTFEPAFHTHTESGGAQTITQTLLVSDADSATLVSAKVFVANGHGDASDTLHFTNQNGITGVYDSATGTLNLSGNASLADYQTALRSVTYENGYLDLQDATQNRLISFTANDGQNESSLYTREISFVIDETINGTPGADTLHGGFGDDTVNGLGGADTLFGDAADDALNGGDGDDVLIGGAGEDVLDGGAGIDEVSYQFAPGNVFVNLTVGQGFVGEAINDLYVSIENITGSDFDDTLDGDFQANNINGLDGNDTVNGNGGHDTIIGGDGNDTLRGDDGNDDLSGGAGTDLVLGGNGDDTIVGGPGDDTLDGGTGIDFLRHEEAGPAVTIDLSVNSSIGQGTDSVSNFANASGTNLNDTITGSGLANVLQGLQGDDVIDGGQGNDAISGGVGADSILGGSGDDNLYGDDGNDTLRGSAGTDDLFGGAGSDILEGGHGADMHDGGPGLDAAVYDNAPSSIIASLVTGGSFGDATGDTFVNIEALRGSAFDDALSGDANNNLLGGGSGDDTLNGDDGDDVLEGGPGADALNGGVGTDIALYNRLGADHLVIDLLNPANNTSDAIGDTFTGIERFYLTAASNVFVADGGGYFARGFEDTDVLTGGAGKDYFIGDSGDDILSGGGERDVLFGGAGNDIINGGDGRDLLVGNNGSDTVSGGAGNDVFLSRDDGTGTDHYDGGDGVDMFSLAGESVGARINLKTANDNGGAVANSTFANIERFVGSAHDDYISGHLSDSAYILGGAGNDTIIGGSGVRDVLLGQDGNDVLQGHSGVDVIFGGRGNDTIFASDDGVRDQMIYNIDDWGSDLIYDFEAGIDKIYFLGVTGLDEFSDLSITTSAGWRPNPTDEGYNRAIIQYGGQQIALSDFVANDFTSADFVFA